MTTSTVTAATTYPDYVRDDLINLSENSREVLRRRYLRKGLDGKPVETPAQMFYRVARHLAAAAERFGGDVEATTRRYYDLLTSLRFFPNSPTFTGAGTPLGQLAACFVLPIEDDMGKHPDGIFQTLRNAALIQQTGGGNGFSFGRLRPRGDKVLTSAGVATGPVGFLEAFDKAFGVIAQGGTRRGANMAVLPVHHPDIEEFITCKAEEGKIANFNISVGITDEFMRAVIEDRDFPLINPRDGKVWRTVRARDLFDKIATYAHRNGEPGVLFLDTANRTNPVPHLYELEATNPCVTGDTLVATPSGWRRADSIKPGDAICTVLGVGRVTTVEVNENMPVYKVYFSDGAVIRATASHQFHARDSRTKFFEPRRLDQLKIGDWVRVYRGVVPDNPVPGKPEQLTDREYGFLVGVLLGDGCYTPRALSRNVVRISTHADEKEWNKVLQLAFARIGAETVSTYVNRGSHSMMMDPKPGKIVADWVKSLPLEPARGPEKRLPEAYINSNREFLIGLLDGLFSTDGSVDLQSNHPLLRFHTSSPALARQVRLILLMFGIYGRISQSVRKRHDLNGREIRHDRPKYDVVISGESLGRFLEQIRLSHPGKQMRLEEAALRCNFTGGNWAARVVRIEPAGIATVYDLYEPKSDTWITEGFVSRGCGEQWLGPYENCCLGSVNLARHVTEEGVIDWDALEETIATATRFLDDVVEMNAYVPAVPQLKEAAHRVRRIGLGIMGLADVMYMLGVRYGSEEGEELASQIMEFVRYHAMRTSIELARERGPFPAIRGSIYDPTDLKWTPPTPMAPYKRDFGRPPLNWDAIVAGIKAHGIRNGAQTTIAPTGCLVPGTLVSTDAGLLPIETLGDRQGRQWQDVDFRVASEDGIRQATHFYINGRAHTLRVTTRRGYAIQGTDGHRIRVFENGEWVWKRLDEVKPGMQVPLQVTGLIGKPRRVVLNTARATDFHASPVRLPEEMTPELAYLIGFFMGDGSLKTRSLRFSISDSRLQSHVTNLVKKVFGMTPEVYQDGRSTHLVSLEVHSLNVVEFWRRNGFARQQPTEAHSGKGYLPHVPLAVLQTNDPDIYGAFLAGLFDADGYLHDRRLPTWTTTCRLFHDQVKTMLLALGVLTTSDIQSTGNSHAKVYRLRVAHAQAAERFRRRLPYLTRLAFDPVLSHRMTVGDTVPVLETEYAAALTLAESGREEQRVWGWRQRGWTASRESLSRFVNGHREAAMEVGLQRLVEAVENEVYYDEIVTVEDGGFVETYDISVPGTHAYNANGFISHNTIGTVTGCEGYGCEPVFALAYTRYVKEADGDVPLTYVSPLFLRALDEAGIVGETRQRIIDEILHTGTCQHIGELPDHILHTFVVSQDITPTEHVRIQAALQRFVDNSISKCVTGDTLILTPKGLVPIASLHDFRLPDQFAPLALPVMTSCGVQTTDAFYYGGYRETRRVTLEYGFFLEGTPNHRIHVLDEQGRVVFRRLDALQIGDLVVLYGGHNVFGEAAAPLPTFSGTLRTSSTPVRFPARMSPDLAFFLGCLTAEGAITVNGVVITSTDRALLEDLQGIAREQFGLEGYIARDSRNEVHYLQLNSRALRHWLLVDLGLQAGAEYKIIPNSILQASQDEVAAFLRGLFLDGYMTQDGKCFGITLASRRLIAQLHVLLLNAGILATVRQVGERAWNLTVQGGELERLAEWISFVEVWKNERFERVNLGRLHKTRNYSRLLPEEVTRALPEMRAAVPVSLRAGYNLERSEDNKAYQRARVNLLAGHRLDRHDARRVYEGLKQAGANHPFADTFFAQDDTKRIYVRVQTIESNYAEVFDISVPGTHEFIANGMCNHNTINFPPTATVEDVKTAYRLAWELGCKGLTVYVTGSREEVVLETKATATAKGKTPTAATSAPAPVPETPAPVVPQRKRRPTRLQGFTYRQPTPLGTAYITVNSDDAGEPFEVFLNVGKAGSDVAAVAEALGRLMSYILRMPSPLPPRERLQQIVYQLGGIGGGRPLGFGPQRVRSLPDAVAQVLSQFLNESEAQTLMKTPPPPVEQMELPLSVGDLCPDCGQATMLYLEGCKKCQNCGYSEC